MNVSSRWPALAWALLFAMSLLRPAAAAPADLADYRLGPGDVVRIQVFQNTDLTTEARVSESGQISFPLLGTLRVGDQTPGEVERTIANRLRDGGFMQRAQVTLNVLQFRSQQVSVLGSVNRPGRYPLETRGTRLTEILATAGGIMPGGSDTLVLLRRTGEKVMRFEVDVPSLYLSQPGERDMEVQGGDSIYVHRAPVYYVFGQVQRPGQFTLERNMNVRQALAKGGGFTMRARENAVVIRRTGEDGRPVESVAGLDEPVRPDDQIYVRESLF
jgi:polysaccharide export outer membrane protein